MTDAVEVGRPRRWGRIVRLALFLIVGIAMLIAPMWAPQILSQLSFFRLRKVEVIGVRYLDPAAVAARLELDTTKSIWIDLTPLEERVAAHSQVADVDIGRRLPGTIVVRVTEHLPVALVPTRSGFQVVDVRGVVLPVDPSRTQVDLPIAAQRDTTLLRLLADIRAEQPGLFERISEARRVGRDELRLQLAGVAVLAMLDVTVQRLADILPVERDLASKRIQAAELDLRYRERVIARLQ
jgi:cell division protein FtsQ